jgi:hypothetical protein
MNSTIVINQHLSFRRILYCPLADLSTARAFTLAEIPGFSCFEYIMLSDGNMVSIVETISSEEKS